MRNGAVAALLVVATSCGQASPVVTGIGAAFVTGGIISQVNTPDMCPDGCIGPPSYLALSAIGIPLLVIGGLSWLAQLAPPSPASAPAQPAAPRSTLPPIVGTND